MDIFKYKDAQLSIFDLQIKKKNRDEFIKILDEVLRIPAEPSPQQMTQECILKNEQFDTNTRLFLKQCALKVYEDQTFSSKQVGYLKSCWIKLKN